LSAILKPKKPSVDVHSPAAAAAALRTFFKIAERWQLSVPQQLRLLDASRSTLYAWRNGDVKAALDRGQLERLSYVFGIFKALEMLFPQPGRADAWIRQVHSLGSVKRQPPGCGIDGRHLYVITYAAS